MIYSIASAVGPGVCGPRVIRIEEFSFGAVPLVPVGAHDHPLARANIAMLGFPGLDMRDGQQEIVILGRFPGTIDDIDRGNEILAAIVSVAPSA